MISLFRPRRALLTFTLGVLALARAASAQDAPAVDAQVPAHISFVDGTAILERDGTIDDSPASMPLLAGDRVRTRSGRVEILFADGSTLHLDHHSAIDLQSDELVRLIEGRIRLSIAGPPRAVSYRIDAPHGWAHVSDPGDYRIALISNAGGGELELSVIRGRAELENEHGRTPLRAGERGFVRAGAAPSAAYVANSSAVDAFDQWSEARRDERLAASAGYLPDDVRPYASTFERYGYWRDEPGYGRVWYPRVAVGWRPYYYGRWASLRPYGWTWIAHDPWGWPTHHYGRWGISPAGAWFWIPGRRWGAAWVSWAYAPGYVSWCPLDWNNRPLFHLTFGRGYDPWRAWTVVPHRSFGYGFVHRNVVTVGHIDRRVVSSFAARDRAPEIVGRAVPRASAPITVAGTSVTHRGASPLYTNRPADQARPRMRTDGARIRIPDRSPAASSQPQPGVVARDRPLASRPAVRSERPTDSGRRPVPIAKSPRSDLEARRPEARQPDARTPGLDGPRALDARRPDLQVGRERKTEAPRRLDVPVHRGRPPAPARQAPPGYDRPSPSHDARPRAIPRAEPSPSGIHRAPQGEHRGPERASPGPAQRRGPAQAQPFAPPAAGSGKPASAPPVGARPRPSGGRR